MRTTDDSTFGGGRKELRETLRTWSILAYSCALTERLQCGRHRGEVRGQREDRNRQGACAVRRGGGGECGLQLELTDSTDCRPGVRRGATQIRAGT